MTKCHVQNIEDLGMSSYIDSPFGQTYQTSHSQLYVPSALTIKESPSSSPQRELHKPQHWRPAETRAAWRSRRVTSARRSRDHPRFGRSSLPGRPRAPPSPHPASVGKEEESRSGNLEVGLSNKTNAYHDIRTLRYQQKTT